MRESKKIGGGGILKPPPGSYRVKINEDKTYFIIFSAHEDQYKHIRLTVGTDNVQASESIKILGVTLDHNMNMKKAIANTCRSDICIFTK